MAVVASKEEVLQQELRRIAEGAFLREGQQLFQGDQALEYATNRQNVQTEGQSSLQAGDVFTIPATEEEFNKCLFAQKFNANQVNPTIGLVVVVDRRGTFVPLRLYSTAFTRGYYKEVAGKENVFETEYTYPSGKPAKDVRDTPGSVLDALKVLMGKTIKVDRVDKISCQVIKRGAQQNADGTWPMDRGTRRLPALSYVEDAASTTNAPTEAAAPAASGRGRNSNN